MLWNVCCTAWFILGSLLFFGHCVTSLFVPDAFTSIVHLLYSKIPPIKKGADSRFGIGFRLGQHADFQILFEVGPQQYTETIGPDADALQRRNDESHRRNEILPDIRNYELQLAKLRPKLNQNFQGKENLHDNTVEKNKENNWLLEWRQGYV